MPGDPSVTGQSHWEKAASQLVRYEALFQLLDEMLVQDDILTVASLIAKKWKYFSNVASWHLAIADTDGFLLIDGFQGNATISHSAVLPPWDQQFWDNPRPTQLIKAELDAHLTAPVHLCGDGVHEVLVLPIASKDRHLSMISMATRHQPFSETDRRFILLFCHQFIARIRHLLLAKKLIQTLTSKAIHDSLTGILNRGSIMEQLNSKLALSRRSAQPLAIVMADLDHFKFINDTYGHQAGDEVLQEVPRRMRQLSRYSDSFGRYGGEEFLFVLYPCTREEVTYAAERLLACVSELPVTLNAHGPSAGEHEVRITLSAGCACMDGQTDLSADVLLKRADQALYEAKANGRNRIALAP
jgi:diguanylate cyclase (GGDEF)-like protein